MTVLEQGATITAPSCPTDEVEFGRARAASYDLSLTLGDISWECLSD